MVKEIQLVLPCCEKYFKEDGVPPTDKMEGIVDAMYGVNTGRYNSSEPNESMPPRDQEGNPDGYVVITKEPGMESKDVLRQLADGILNHNK